MLVRRFLACSEVSSFRLWRALNADIHIIDDTHVLVVTRLLLVYRLLGHVVWFCALNRTPILTQLTSIHVVDLVILVWADLAGDPEMAVCLEAGGILGQCLLQVFYLALQILDMLEILILHGNFVAELIVDLLFLVLHDIVVLIIEEYSSLLGREERHWGLRAFLAGDHDSLSTDAFLIPLVERTVMRAFLGIVLLTANALALLQLPDLLRLRI